MISTGTVSTSRPVALPRTLSSKHLGEVAFLGRFEAVSHLNAKLCRANEILRKATIINAIGQFAIFGAFSGYLQSFSGSFQQMGASIAYFALLPAFTAPFGFWYAAYYGLNRVIQETWQVSHEMLHFHQDNESALEFVQNAHPLTHHKVEYLMDTDENCFLQNVDRMECHTTAAASDVVLGEGLENEVFDFGRFTEVNRISDKIHRYARTGIRSLGALSLLACVAAVTKLGDNPGLADYIVFGLLTAQSAANFLAAFYIDLFGHNRFNQYRDNLNAAMATRYASRPLPQIFWELDRNGNQRLNALIR